MRTTPLNALVALSLLVGCGSVVEPDRELGAPEADEASTADVSGEVATAEVAFVCGDTMCAGCIDLDCQVVENCSTCPEDCGSCPVHASEVATADVPFVCGDTICVGCVDLDCQVVEDCSTCPEDCGSCPGYAIK